MKIEILNFSKKLSKGRSYLISNIARSSYEIIKLNYTTESLCDNLSNLYEEEKEILWDNYLNEVKKNIDNENAVVLFDDSDINKEYSKKIEVLNRVIDGLSQIVRGIKEILKYAHNGIKERENIKVRTKYNQLSLNL